MRLNKLILENFQGIKELSLDFNGESMAIKGKNATGKTTIANAYSWLLTDKPINGEKGYTPKTRDGDGEAHYLEHSVTAEFTQDDAGYFTLKKVFHEKWTQKRGKAAEEFTGHVVDYYIDDVPVKMKDFNEFIYSIAMDQATLQLLLNVDAFASMKWQDRRKLLLEVCGDVSDETIIASTSELEELNDILNNGTRMLTVDEYLAKAKVEMRKLNKEIDSGIPERINEAKKAIPEGADSIDRAEIEKEIKSLEAQKNTLTDKKNELKASDQDEIKRKQLHDIESRIEKARLEHRGLALEANFKWQDKMRSLQSDVDNIQSRIDSTERSIRNSENDLKYSESRREALITQWKMTNSKQWEGSDICPTCGQTLPYEMIEEAKAKFNHEKSKKLEEINQMGKAVSMDSIKEQREFIKQLKDALQQEGTELVLAKQSLTEFKAKEPVSQPFEETEEYLSLKAEKDALTAGFDAGEMVKSQLKVIDDSIDAINKKIDKHKNTLYQADVFDRQTKRVAELEQELRSKSIAYEQLQKGVYLCEEFTKAKVEYTDKAIADVFSTVKFRMFETQINGGLKACCDVMVPDGKGNYVPYASANNAARIRAGLEIIKVLSNHYDVHVPVFIDNAEGIDHAIEEEGMQIISLLVERDNDNEGQTITL